MKALRRAGVLLASTVAVLVLSACGDSPPSDTVMPVAATAGATAAPINTPTSPPDPASTATVRTPGATTGATATSAAPLPLQPVKLEPAFGAADFVRPTNLVQPDDGTGRMYLAEQPGRVLALNTGPNGDGGGVFLDILDRVNDSGNEEGLLGLAFAPDYAESGYFFVYYSAAGPRRSVVSRFSVSPGDPGTADPASESVMLEVSQPFRNHNGGQLAFGPDGFLYIGLGDGGSGGDPQGNGQDPTNLLGSILRIDVADSSLGTPYSVPADNPFSGAATARSEVWAYGFRNPWRFSFDRDTGRLWAGDVWQSSWEEVDLVEKGGNHGWNTLEGTHCFRPKTSCQEAGTVLPVVEYSAAEGCSVIGGYVYRGPDAP